MRSYLTLAFLPPIIAPSSKGSHDCDDWTETEDCRELCRSLGYLYYCRCYCCHSKVFILQSPPLLGYTRLFFIFLFFWAVKVQMPR